MTAGYEHRIRLGPDTPLDSNLRAGISGGHYASKGEEYQHDEVMVWLGGRKELFANFTLDVMGSYAYKPFENKSTFLALNDLVDCPLAPEPCSLSGGSDREENLWFGTDEGFSVGFGAEFAGVAVSLGGVTVDAPTGTTAKFASSLMRFPKLPVASTPPIKLPPIRTARVMITGTNGKLRFRSG